MQCATFGVLLYSKIILYTSYGWEEIFRDDNFMGFFPPHFNVVFCATG